jgi:WD40 repeat protein
MLVPYKKSIYLIIVSAFTFFLILIMGINVVSEVQEVIIRLHKTINYNPPKRFIPGDEDKAGYWYQEDYGTVVAFDFSLDTNLLAAVIEKRGQSTRLFIMDLESGETKYKPVISNTRDVNIKSLRFSPDGKMIAIPTGKDFEISLWNVESGALIDKGKTDGYASDTDWHPSGNKLAITAGKRVEIWDVSPLKRQKLLPGGRGRYEVPMCVGWSNDGEYFAIGTNNPAVYIATERSQSPALSPKPKGSIYTIKWNDTDTYIAAAGFGSGGTINVWSNPKTAIGYEKNYKLIKSFIPQGTQSWKKITWNPSGQLIAFGDDSSNFFVWRISPIKLMKKFRPYPGSDVIEAHWKDKYLITVAGYPDKSFKIYKVEVR